MDWILSFQFLMCFFFFFKIQAFQFYYLVNFFSLPLYQLLSLIFLSFQKYTFFLALVQVFCFSPHKFAHIGIGTVNYNIKVAHFDASLLHLVYFLCGGFYSKTMRQCGCGECQWLVSYGFHFHGFLSCVQLLELLICPILKEQSDLPGIAVEKEDKEMKI